MVKINKKIISLNFIILNIAKSNDVHPSLILVIIRVASIRQPILDIIMLLNLEVAHSGRERNSSSYKD
jgi:hypothetical protein